MSPESPFLEYALYFAAINLESSDDFLKYIT